jgi:membrane-associated phospholipid phosphatase
MKPDPITGGISADGWTSDSLALLLLLLVVILFACVRRAFIRRQPGIRNWLLECRRVVASDHRIRHWKENHPGFVAFVQEKLSRSHYLVLHLILGFAVVALFSRLLAELTEAILENSPLVMVDRWVFQALNSVRTPLMTGIMERITFLGGGEVITAGALLVCFVLLLRKRFAELVGLFAAVLGGSLLSLVMKAAINRPRPPMDVALSPFGASFPSGHALMSVLFYGFCAYLSILSVKTMETRSKIVTWAVFLVFMIGVSRLYLGVHYLSDVAAGFTAGICWLVVCATGVELFRRRGFREPA